MWGEWIEIGFTKTVKNKTISLSPCGESGLKLEMGDTVEEIFTSLPVWGEWIEICHNER